MGKLLKDELKNLTPAIDIIEREDHYLMLADLPGASEDSIDVTVNRDILTITAEARMEPVEGMNEDYSEFGSCRYSRTFRVLDDIDRDNIKAQYRAGVLSLRIPKAEHLKTKRIAIEASK